MSKPFVIYIDGLEIPVTPASLDTSSPSGNNFLKLLNGETFTVLQKPDPDEWSFEFFALSKEHPSVDKFTPQDVIKDKFKELKSEGKVFEFIVLRSTSDINLKNSFCKFMTLEDHKIQENAEWGNNIKISLDLKENFPLKTIKLVDSNTSRTENNSYKIQEAADANKNPPIEIEIDIVL